MPVTPQAVTHLEAKGHDAVHAFAIGLGASPDSDILEHARAVGGIIWKSVSQGYRRPAATVDPEQRSWQRSEATPRPWRPHARASGSDPPIKDESPCPLPPRRRGLLVARSRCPPGYGPSQVTRSVWRGGRQVFDFGKRGVPSGFL